VKVPGWVKDMVRVNPSSVSTSSVVR
jgi:hypothetical protein